MLDQALPQPFANTLQPKDLIRQPLSLNNAFRNVVVSISDLRLFTNSVVGYFVICSLRESHQITVCRIFHCPLLLGSISDFSFVYNMPLLIHCVFQMCL